MWVCSNKVGLHSWFRSKKSKQTSNLVEIVETYSTLVVSVRESIVKYLDQGWLVCHLNDLGRVLVQSSNYKCIRQSLLFQLSKKTKIFILEVVFFIQSIFTDQNNNFQKNFYNPLKISTS